MAIQTNPIVTANNEIVLTYTMNGFWFGVLNADKNRSLEYIEDKNAVLCLLSDILFSVLEDNCFRSALIQFQQTCRNISTLTAFSYLPIRKIHPFGKKMFVYGRDGVVSSRKTRPKTIWKITIAAEQQLIKFLQSKPDSTNLKLLTASSFLEVNVVVKCRQVTTI